MITTLLSKLSSNIKLIIGCSLIFNIFGLKLFIDIGNYNIIDPYLFFHYIMSLVFIICASIKGKIKSRMDLFYLIAIPLTVY